MKWLLAVILLAAGLWSGYWFFSSSALQSEFTGWFEDRRDDGWAADYSDLAVKGFPNRHDVVLQDVRLADPERGLAWNAPEFKVLALSYKPSHLIVIWPGEQDLATPLGKTTIRSDQMRASLVFATRKLDRLQRANFVGEGLAFETPSGDLAMSALRAAVAEEEAANSYKIAITGEGVSLPPKMRARVDTGGVLPETFDRLRADLSVGFDGPWGTKAIRSERPQPRKLDLRLAEAKWGKLELQMAGGLDIDDQGWPTGRMVIKAKNWRDVLVMARETTSVPASILDGVEQALQLASALSGNRKTLDIPLDFRGQRMWLGPLPIASAPRIEIR